MCLSNNNEITAALDRFPIDGEEPKRDKNVKANPVFPSATKLLFWILFTYASKEFSVFLPAFQSKAGADTFIPASYKYDDEHTHFDNSILTWGTDYALVVIMCVATYKCLTAYNHTGTHTTTPQTTDDPLMSKSLRIKSACLFFSYAVSVFAGGYAHQNFTGM